MGQETFWKHVDKQGDCWLWMGALTNGYGQVHVNNRHGYAHRFSWEFVNGQIPDGMVICHHCDVKRCVNPKHLFIGTQLDNVRDCIAKGRFKSKPLYGSDNGFAKLDEIRVANIRNDYSSGDKSVRGLAAIYGVSKSTIWNVISNKYWRLNHGV